MKIFKVAFLIISSLILFSTSCKKDDSGDSKPIARFTTPIIEFGNVTFRNYSENATEFLWDFADGNTSTEKDPVYKYKELGVFDVKLTASNGIESDIYILTVAIGQIYPDNLSELEPLPFGQRSEMFFFTKNGKGYVGGGIDKSSFQYGNDLWEFDPISKDWTLLSNDLPLNYSSGSSFLLNDKAYMGLGSAVFGSEALAMFSYDFVNNSFFTDSYLPGNQTSVGIIVYPTSTVHDGKAYLIGRGNQEFLQKRMWEYDPNNQSWTNIDQYECAGNSGMLHFILDDKLYIGGGNEQYYSNFDNESDIWEYNFTTNSWTQKNDFPGGARRDGISFTYGGNGYFGFGVQGDPLTGGIIAYSDLWKYDSSNDTWEKIADMPVSSNRNLFAFILGNSLFFGGGSPGTFGAVDNFYEYEFD